MLIDTGNRDFACAASQAIFALIESVHGLQKDSDDLTINTDCGALRFYHIDDCCEFVTIEDFEQDGDLIGARILSIELCESEAKSARPPKYAESYTWTFYRINTNKGGLFLRFLGESNGYYSESVDVSWEPSGRAQ